MRNALASKIDRLEAGLSPQPRTSLTVTFARTDEELDQLRANCLAQGDMYIVTWLPTADDPATIGG
jgi:hypothetical protein